MIDQPLSLPDEIDLLEWDALNPAQIELSAAQIQRAAQVSRSIRSPEHRWQVYLTALGVLGFEQWISDRAPELTIQINQSSIWNPSAHFNSAACNIRVGEFKICVISVGSLMDNFVSVPVAAFDSPEFAAHLYVLMQAIDEEEKAAVFGFLNYEQYRQLSLRAATDQTYSLPIDAFNTDANALLLNLRCLEPSAIRLPIIEEKCSSAMTLEPLINVGRWLSNQLDTVAQELGWVLMPVFSPVRTLREEFDSIRFGLEQQGVQIPSSARGAYRSIKSEQGSFRFYALTWTLVENPDQPEWMLLVALGSEPDAEMPRNLKLEVRDQAELLFQESLEATNRGVLYAQVVGNWNERFWVKITANRTEVTEIPPFGFAID